jgi:SPFH domain / Band 7 family
MKGAATFAAVAAFLVILVLLLSAAFTVEQTEQAIVLRFGEPVAGRGLVTTPGLHFKYPFIESAVYLDNRILNVEAPKQEVLASDNNRLEVDSFLRYRIVDPLKFYQIIGSDQYLDRRPSILLDRRRLQTHHRVLPLSNCKAQGNRTYVSAFRMAARLDVYRPASGNWLVSETESRKSARSGACMQGRHLPTPRRMRRASGNVLFSKSKSMIGATPGRSGRHDAIALSKPYHLAVPAGDSLQRGITFPVQ